MRKFLAGVREQLARIKSHERRYRRATRLTSEELENRVVPAVSIASLGLADGSLNSGGAWESPTPTISGVVQEIGAGHSVRIEIDHEGDGYAESSWDQSSDAFQYDAWSINSALTGFVQLRVRASELDDDGVTVLNNSDWISIGFTIVPNDPQGGDEEESGEGDSGGGEGDGEQENGGGDENPGEEQQQYVAPTIDSFFQGEQAGDWYIFSGHAGGSAVSGATVTFSGVLEGLTATVDAEGNFTTAAYFLSGAQGIAYAQLTDGQATASNLVSLYVDIPSATPGGDESGEGGGGEGGEGEGDPGSDEDGEGENGDPGDGDEGNSGAEQGDPEEQGQQYVSPSIDVFAQTEQAGDWYVFTGHVGGSAVSGATVTFMGILDGLSGTVDGDGNFTTSGFFPTGVQGIAYAQVIDGQGAASNLMSLYVDIPNTTP